MAAKKGGQGITQWPETERPRERLLSQGPHVLTDAQLLAILLRVGRRGSSAVQVGMGFWVALVEWQGLHNAELKSSVQSQVWGRLKLLN